jgi:hypothetical protein
MSRLANVSSRQGTVAQQVRQESSGVVECGHDLSPRDAVRKTVRENAAQQVFPFWFNCILSLL